MEAYALRAFYSQFPLVSALLARFFSVCFLSKYFLVNGMVAAASSFLLTRYSISRHDTPVWHGSSRRQLRVQSLILDCPSLRLPLLLLLNQSASHRITTIYCSHPH